MSTWDCEAYGPDGRAVDALCFFAEPGERSCGTQGECRTRLASERVRVFDRIRELADAGDPAAAYLAGEFTSPGQILGGDADAAETREEYIARVRRQSMRDHPFEPSDDPRYCGHWSGSSRTTESGTLSLSSQCGYPPDMHPSAANNQDIG